MNNTNTTNSVESNSDSRNGESESPTSEPEPRRTTMCVKHEEAKEEHTRCLVELAAETRVSESLRAELQRYEMERRNLHLVMDSLRQELLASNAERKTLQEALQEGQGLVQQSLRADEDWRIPSLEKALKKQHQQAQELQTIQSDCDQLQDDRKVGVETEGSSKTLCKKQPDDLQTEHTQLQHDHQEPSKELESLRNLQQDCQSDLKDLQSKHEQLQAKYGVVLQRDDDHRQQLAQSQSLVQSQETKLQRLQSENARLEGDRKVALEWVAEHRKQVESYRLQTKDLREQLHHKDHLKQEFRKTLAQLECSYTERIRDLESTCQELRAKDAYSQHLQDLHRRLDRAAETTHQRVAQCWRETTLEGNRNRDRRRYQGLEAQVTLLQQEKVALVAQVASLEEKSLWDRAMVGAGERKRTRKACAETGGAKKKKKPPKRVTFAALPAPRGVPNSTLKATTTTTTTTTTICPHDKENKCSRMLAKNVE